MLLGLDGTVRARAAIGQDPIAVALSPDGHTAYVSDNAAGVVRALSIPQLAVRWQAKVGGRPGPLLVTFESVLVSLFETGQVVALSLNDGSVLARHTVGSGPGQIVLSGNRILVACADGRVWDLDGGSMPAAAGFALGVGAGGTWSASQASGELVRLEDGARARLPAHKHPFWAITGPNGSLWISAEGDDEDRDPGAVAILDSTLHTRVVASPRDPDAIANAGDRMFVAAHGDHSVLVFDRDGRQVVAWARGSAPVALAADIPQGLLVVVTNAHE